MVELSRTLSLMRVSELPDCAGGPNKVVLPLESIKAVKRVKFAQLFNNAMEVHLASGDELYFSGFLHRNDCVACIEQQAAKRGHPLVVL